MWLFGGFGVDVQYSVGYLNDLWDLGDFVLPPTPTSAVVHTTGILRVTRTVPLSTVTPTFVYVDSSTTSGLARQTLIAQQDLSLR